MHKIYKYKNGEIKLFKNEFPMVKDYEYTWKCFQAIRKTKQLDNELLLGIELMIHMGGRMCYGLLAFRIKPSECLKMIKVYIAYTNKNLVRYKNSCLLDDKFVYKGLPEEYMEYLSNSILETILVEKDFPQCDLFLEYAANCEVGSNPAVFGYIAEILIHLISSNLIDEAFNMDIKQFTELFVKNINLRY